MHPNPLTALQDATLTVASGHRTHTALYYAHQSAHQFSSLAKHNPSGVVFLLAIVAAIALVISLGVSRARSDARR